MADKFSCSKRLSTLLIQPHTFALPKYELPFFVDTDSWNYQVMAVLFQTYLGKEHKPLGFWSRSLNPNKKNYFTTEMECLAVVYALLTLHFYLQGHHFTAHFD